MNPDQLELVADIVRAYVSNNSVPRADLPALIADVSKALDGLNAPAAAPIDAEAERKPAVNPKKSVFPDYIVSLENGKHFRSLKRHLGVLGMTPEQYREKWNLPRDYPMVAQSYATQRSELAKKLGLGRKAAAAQDVEEAQEAPVEVAAAEAAPKPRKPRARKTAETAA